MPVRTFGSPQNTAIRIVAILGEGESDVSKGAAAFSLGLRSLMTPWASSSSPSWLASSLPANLGGALSYAEIGLVFGRAVAFLFGALLLGVWLSPRLFNLAARLRGEGVLLATALVFCIALAYLGSVIGLAPIVGAYPRGRAAQKVDQSPLGK